MNAYVKEHMGEEFTAKDFRTWAGTVGAAVALDEAGPVVGRHAQQRVVARVCRSTADLLGNTPGVARAHYIDPRVIEHYLHGRTIASVADRVSGADTGEHGLSWEERAVLALLGRAMEDREREPPAPRRSRPRRAASAPAAAAAPG